MKHKKLMTPGPSPVPAFLREVLAKEIIHHRTEEFRNILADVHRGLQNLLFTKNPVVVLSASGTGAMEAAVSNLFSKGDKIIAISGGKFGQRWAEIANSFSLDVIEMKVEWGATADSKKLEEILNKNKGIKAVLTTLCETSTATVHDIENIAKTAKQSEAITVVDAISGLGQDKLLTDQWGVDVVVGGSQKGLMLPPGLSFLSIGDKAKSLMEESNLPKYYFDLKKALNKHKSNDTPYTPAVTLVTALAVALDAINKEGVEKRWEKFEKLAEATRSAAEALGLSVLSSRPSASTTAIKLPDNIKSSQIVKILREKYGLAIAGGQAQLKDKIVRIAHMGWINAQDLISCFSLFEVALKEVGHQFKSGSSLARLEEAIYG
ncbi:MAG: alanine--glyoxylate aminotransferase family protein [Candidatus Omnitrophica bacterium]|nr:alanine--glyoxylate aminotransferase family protein [Candidatus Omnitrophota bacterium]MCF7878953.1 alanine--glyoxylate aminotransferase family protein [Candidatus Omnitrophota bacterium]MCF7893003.1 alanine--glyoxylate aminotransferase family protein [Candidatus Omnitrophota bacterium]